MNDPWAVDPASLDLSDEMRELIKPELAPDERLLWASRANFRSIHGGGFGSLAGTALWGAGFLIVSVVGFALAFLFPLRLQAIDPAILLFSMACAVIAFFIIIGTVGSLLSKGSEQKQLKGRIYALTDRRAIIWCPDPGSRAIAVHTFPRGSIKVEDIKRTQYVDGSGSVLIRPMHLDPSGFLGIADVRRVEEMVRRFLVADGPGSTP